MNINYPFGKKSMNQKTHNLALQPTQKPLRGFRSSDLGRYVAKEAAECTS